MAVLRSSVVARHAGFHLREVPVVVVAWKAPLPRTLTEALVPISIRRGLIAGTPMHSLINWLVLGGFIIGSLGMLAGSSALLVLTFCRRTASKFHAPTDGAESRKPLAPHQHPCPRSLPSQFLGGTLLGAGLAVASTGSGMFQSRYSLPGGTEAMNAIAAAMITSGGLMILTALRLFALKRRSIRISPSDVG